METNPYSPGAGRLPVAFVGRQRELDVWSGSVRRVMVGRDARSLVLTGLRGMGKTVLLTNFAQTARDKKWMVAQVEAGAGKGLRQLIAERFQAQLSDIARGGAGQRTVTAIKSLLSFVKPSVDPMTGSWSFGLDFSGASGGGADTGILEADLGRVLTDLTEVAKERGVGVALLVDEAQGLKKEELAAFCQIIQAAGQSQAPLLVALAGLPNLPLKLAEAKTYAERLFDYHTVGALSSQESRAALLEPAAQEHVAWTNEAADLVLEAAHGYPYFIQQFGSDTWDAATSSPITPDVARVGLAAGKASLDAGFYRARWDRATPAERDYLRAMAPDGDGGSTTGQIAARLGRTPSSLSPTRSNLIVKGLIFAPDQGRLAFTVPAMGEFIIRQKVSDQSA